MWTRVATAWLPFADGASAELPLGRLLRLSLFQVSAGMTAALLSGTLNRVLIVELGVSSGLVAALIAIPLLLAPFRAFIGHRSDHHRSVLGWRRVPYLWFGTLLQFGGLALMPFALLILSTEQGRALGLAASGFAFLLTGAGLHVAQTAGLALVADLAPEDRRPRAVALLYVMLLLGTMVSALVIGAALADFSATRLVQVIQGAALAALLLNIAASWKQESRRSRAEIAHQSPAPAFGEMWARLMGEDNSRRLLLSVGLGTAAFTMQDVLLEPYGGEILGLAVGVTTSLTALWALGALCGFALAGARLARGSEPHRLAGFGCVAGLAAFTLVIFAAPASNPFLLMAGAALIGFGGGLFMVGTLVAAMTLAQRSPSGLALGAWGAVQASAAGAAILLGGIARDAIAATATAGQLGETLAVRATGYGAVYTAEIVLLLLTIAVLGPLVRAQTTPTDTTPRFGLAHFPS
ncbi:BCD family MFS transporter [Sphingomonas glaciei]|uniref:BCD family MFS transporter n=2 Tax=Sphingomonas glaciei TaxID=2938948 RepID=A0ABY5MYH4_9SPHN|nr:BCD family MFS transporter [Sphingomonas glaciei]